MFLKIGIVGRALGLQGSFYVSGRDEKIPAGIKKIYVGSEPETAKVAEVISSGWQNGRPFLKCSLADNRTSAELITGQVIWLDASSVEVDDSKEYLISDLKGRLVIDCDGVEVGVVEDVMMLPASNNLIVFNLKRNADVDVPMISQYVDMNFQRGGKDLKLLVTADVFDEIWNARDKKQS
jgi:ribosomal 30S subunit maturation factor RimM